MNINSYPLSWPDGWKRAESRKRANFNSRKETGASYRMKRPLTIAEGIGRVLDALKKMGVPNWNVIISTNMPVRQDGLPYSGRKDPEDPGAAVYWRAQNDDERCIAIDQYDRLADNLAAIAGTLEALRAVERWGGAAILDRAFTGFQALPDHSSTGWWVVLEVPRDADHSMVERAYKLARSRNHPDKGGDPEHFSAVQVAWFEYQQSRGAA